MSQPHRKNSPGSEGPPVRHRRRVKLIRPLLQWRLIATFLGVSLLALTVQFSLFAFLALRFANRLAKEGEYLVSELPRMLGLSLVGSLVVLLPTIVLVGIATTFRFAGPLHRFSLYFRALAAGEQLGPCRIRKGDELQDLCEELNQAIEAVRRQARASAVDAARAGEGPPDGAGAQAA